MVGWPRIHRAAGFVSAKVICLTEGVLKAMLLSKLKVAGVAVLALALAVPVGVSYRATAAAPAQAGNKLTADDLDDLREELQALRRELRATRDRVKALETEVRALRGRDSAPGLNRAPAAAGSPAAPSDLFPAPRFTPPRSAS